MAAALVCDGAAWQAGLSAHGRPTRLFDAVARYTLGSMLNALAPARLGSMARLGLFTRAAGAGPTVATAATIGGANLMVLAGLTTIGLGPSVLPVPPAAVVSVAIVAALAGCRHWRRLGTRRIAPVILLATVFRMTAAAAVAAAFGVHSPVAAGCAMLAAVGLAGTLPLTPGNAGVGAAAVAFALAGRGVPSSTGLAAGIAFALVETLVALAFGALGGALLLARRCSRIAASQKEMIPRPAHAEQF